MTTGPYDHREPQYAPDGQRIALSSDRGGSYGIHLLDLATGGLTAVTDTASQEYEPAWSPDGGRIAFVVDNTRIDVVELASGTRTTAVTVPAGQVLHSPAWTPDGRELVYYLLAGDRTELMRGGSPLVTGEQVFPFRVSWLSPTTFLYTADGRIRRRTLTGGRPHDIGFAAAVPLVRPAYRRRHRDFDSPAPKPVLGIGSPQLSPDGRRIAFRALNDIYTMTIGAAAAAADRRLLVEVSDPAWSPDGRYLSYSTDRRGKLDIWLRELGTGEERQLTDLPGAAAVSGAWSADSSQLAFLDQAGALYTVEVATGAVRQVFSATFEPGRPTWSADGRVIALAAIVPYSARFREGLSKILLVDRATGSARYVDPLPHRSIQTRGDDGPVWSPDGTRMAFVVGSVLWVVAVHAGRLVRGRAAAGHHRGHRRAELERRLRRAALPEQRPAADRRGRRPADPDRPDGADLGQHPAPRPDRDPRRAAVGRAEPAAAPRRRRRGRRPPDHGRRAARGATAATAGWSTPATRSSMPGLVDMHHHREMQGYSYGDRQGRLWLSLGVTTTRSPGSPAYHMVEDARVDRSPAPGSARATSRPARPSTARGSSTTSCGRPSTGGSSGSSWSARPRSTTT